MKKSMANEEGPIRQISTKYQTQAKKYEEDKKSLIQILDSLKVTTDEVEGMLTSSFDDTKNDYFTNRIKESNNSIVTDLSDIKTKLESVSSNLNNEAKRLDNIDTQILNENNDNTN